jgi:hypothetical protein
MEADVVEDVELALWAPVAGVGQAGGLEVGFRLASDVARIARVGLPGQRIDDVADQGQRRYLADGVDDGRRRIGNDEHVALVDLLPAPDGRAVEAESVLEDPLLELADGHREVLPLPRQVGKLQVDDLQSLRVGPVDHALGVARGRLTGRR